MKFPSSLLLCFILTLSIKINGQDIPQLVDSKKLISTGINYFENEKLDSALYYFDQVPRFDTNYSWATYEKALTLSEQKNYSEAIKLAEYGLTLKPTQVLNYNVIGTSYDGLEEYQKALDAYDKGLARFPLNHDLLFNKAVCYQLWGKDEKAIEQHFDNLNFIPYSTSTHLRLGLLADEQGLATQAMLSFAFYLIIDPDGGRSFGILNEMNKLGQLSSEIYKSKDDNKTIKSEFDKQDLIFNNKIPLNDNYKIPGKYNFAFLKQLHAIFEFLKKDKNLKPGLWTDFYTPIFKEIAQNIKFEDLSLILLASATDEDLAKDIEKQLSIIIATRNQILNIITKYNDKIEINVDGKPQEFGKYFTKLRLDAIGNKTKDGLKEGKWFVYSTDGYLQAAAQFEKDKQTGTWHYFNDNGDTISIVNYANGERNGLFTLYYDNGVLKEQVKYIKGKKEGEWRFYYPSGNLKIKEQVKDDKNEGPGERYYLNGTKEYTYTYVNAKLEGPLLEYYANGNVYESTEYVANEKNGEYKSFFRNNTLQTSYKFLKGLSDGEYKKYHVNGNLYSLGQLKKNNAVGSWKYYSFEGLLQQEAELDESGKINGKSKSYDYNGKLYEEASYLKGELKSQVIYDTLGKIIYEVKIPASGTEVSLYNHRREVVSKGQLNKKGKQGLWKFYNTAGVVKEETEYKDDVANGKSITYHSNGNIKQISYFKNGGRDSTYVEYFSNNTLKEAGNYVNGERWQQWNEYYVNGQPYSSKWYQNGLIAGTRTYYDSYGKKVSTEYFDSEGTFYAITEFDSLETVIDSVYLLNGNGPYELKHLNGKPSVSTNYFGGYVNGKKTTYHPNGQVNSEGDVIGGYQNGKWSYYYPNGQVLSSGEFNQGDYMGTWTRYNFFGGLDDADTYLFDKENGLSLNYYPNGKQRSTREFLNGESHGAFTYYEPNGALMIVRYYEHGKLIGYSYNNSAGTLLPMIPIKNETVEIKSFYPNGKIATEYTIDKGSFQGKLTHYYPNGDLLHTAAYKDDNTIGVYQYFYPGNKIMQKVGYELDRMHGPFIEQYENGNPKVKGNYHYGTKNGIFTYFDENGNVLAKYLYRNNDIVDVIK